MENSPADLSSQVNHYASQIYVSADLCIDLSRRTVTKAGKTLTVTGLTYRLLVALIEASGGIVSIDQLSHDVWDGKVVSDETFAQRISLLRKALEENEKEYIESVRGQGYRWVPPVSIMNESFRSKLSNKVWVLLSALLTGAFITYLVTTFWNEKKEIDNPTSISLVQDEVSMKLDRAEQYLKQYTPQSNSYSINMFRSIIKGEPHNKRALSGLAVALLHRVSKFGGEENDLIEAEEITARLISEDKTNPDLLTLRGFYFDVAGNITSAIKLYENSLILEPDSERTKSALAYLYTQKGNLHEALQLNLDTLSSPQRYQILQIAEIFQLAGMTELATEWLLKAREMSPDDPFAMVQNIKFEFVNGRAEFAKELVDNMHRNGFETSDSRELAAIIALYENEFKYAQKEIIRSLELKPNSFYASSWLAFINSRLGHSVKDLSVNPTEDDWPNAWVAKAIYEMANQNHEQAIEALNTAEKLGYLDYKLVQILPAFVSLQEEPGFISLVEKMKRKTEVEKVKLQNYALPRMVMTTN